MQELKVKKNKEICRLLGDVVVEKLGRKKKSILAYESDLPRSVVYYIIDGVKDPQLTTFWRLALGLGVRPSELLKMIEDRIDWDILK